MAEVVKKAKAPAKPRKTAAKKETVSTASARPVLPSHEEIRSLARHFWAQNGYQDGYAERDWLRAEHELRARAS
jgi:hypothetical protein